MQIIETKQELQEQINLLRDEGDNKIAFIPTMGALHEGHLSLIELAKKYASKIVVSIFVNPTQFAENEDFDTYPRQTESDVEKLAGYNIDILYLPTKSEIYPENFSKKISTGSIGQELEGVARPHFFDGVALVVSELFEHVKPDFAIFGEKDFQQLHIIKQLDYPDIEIIPAPIIREKDGLAMSSRNMYLSDDNRKIAANLKLALERVKEDTLNKNDVEESITNAKKFLIDSGFDEVDYIEVRDSKTLQRISNNSESFNARILAAAILDGTRLIDNIEVSKSSGASAESIEDNIQDIKNRLQNISKNTDLVAVSKYRSVEEIEQAIIAGQRKFGENKVQEAMLKWPKLKEKYPDVKLHLIGHLQTNKVKDAVKIFDVIEVVDRKKLAYKILSEVSKTNKNPELYIQVNIGKEEQKSGIEPEQSSRFIEESIALGLNIKGVMCIPPAGEDPSKYFEQLAKIRKDNNLSNLSMGMSSDFEIAAKFGATHVRVGTKIFGERGKK